MNVTLTITTPGGLVNANNFGAVRSVMNILITDSVVTVVINDGPAFAMTVQKTPAPPTAP